MFGDAHRPFHHQADDPPWWSLDAKQPLRISRFRSPDARPATSRKGGVSRPPPVRYYPEPRGGPEILHLALMSSEKKPCRACPWGNKLSRRNALPMGSARHERQKPRRSGNDQRALPSTPRACSSPEMLASPEESVPKLREFAASPAIPSNFAPIRPETGGYFP